MTYRSGEGRATILEWCRRRIAEWPPPHALEVVPTSLGPTALLDAGVGRDTVVYLPGTNANIATSLRFLSEFVDADQRIVCADLPGQPGLSTTPRQQVQAAAWATWVDEVLRSVRRGSARVTLAGHSRGAAVALAADPRLVDRLVLMSPAGLVPVRPTWAMLRATVPWLVRRDDAGSRRLLSLMAGPSSSYPDDLVEWMTMLARLTRTTGAPGRSPDHQLHAWRGRDVQVLVGEHDCFFPPALIAPTVATDLSAPLDVVSGAGHLLVDQAPGIAVSRCT